MTQVELFACEVGENIEGIDANTQVKRLTAQVNQWLLKKGQKEGFKVVEIVPLTRGQYLIILVQYRE
ncbi:hypothetical protein KA062_01265 [Patescibacteria group bacterium]|nr:hypothetical protein [Patescibacteria group bacterium]